MAWLDERKSEDGAVGIILEEAGASAIILSYPTSGGWRSRREKEIKDLVARFMTQNLDTMAQAESATSCVFSWISQLAAFASGKRLIEACDLRR